MSFILPFLLRFWKPLTAVAVAALVVGLIYWKGVKDTKEKQVVKDASETIHRIEEAAKIRRKYDKVRDKLHEVRKDPNPDTLDALYTKLLSSRPTQTQNP